MSSYYLIQLILEGQVHSQLALSLWVENHAGGSVWFREPFTLHHLGIERREYQHWAGLFFSPFYSIRTPSRAKVLPHLGWVFLCQLILLGNALTDTPRAVPHQSPR